MSIVKIDYDELEAASRNAKNAAQLFSDCALSVERRVCQPIQNIPGSDSAGHISEATRLVIEKKKMLEGRSKRFSEMSKSINNMSVDLKQHDINSKNSVDRIANSALDLNNRSPFRQFADWLYGVFCVDFMNWNPITRWIGNSWKKAGDWISNKANKIYEWFKHGDGRYYLNIATSILSDVVAMFATVNAILLCAAATAVTGGVAAPLLIAAIASSIGLIMTVVDSMEVLGNNAKALTIYYENDDPGRARFYGDITGVKDATQKYDYGGQVANNILEGIGIGYDVTHTLADITAITAGAVGAAGLNETAVRGADGKFTGERRFTWDKDTAKSRIKEGFKQKIGFETSNGKTKWNAKNLFKAKPKTGALAKDKMYTEHIKKIAYGREKVESLDNIEKSFRSVKKGISHIKKVDSILGHESAMGKRVEDIVGIAKDSNRRFSYVFKDANDVIDWTKKTIIGL